MTVLKISHHDESSLLALQVGAPPVMSSDITIELSYQLTSYPELRLGVWESVCCVRCDGVGKLLLTVL